MAEQASGYATLLRMELMARSRRWARGRAHVESYGSSPVVVFAPQDGLHGNFFDSAYRAIVSRPEWLRRFDKVHAQGARCLPRAERRWRELDSSMSSDALLMNIFCAPGIVESSVVQSMLGIESGGMPDFGWKARVPLGSGRFDRTEVDMRLNGLLVEAKLTENDFQSRPARIVEGYRDFAEVFDRERLARVEIATARVRHASEDGENLSQEFESVLGDPEARMAIDAAYRPAGEPGYASYQLIRNVLAAHAAGCSFCVLHDARRPDLREQWFRVMAAVRSAELRTRLKVLTWQELAACLPEPLQEFLEAKYGIAAPGRSAVGIDAGIDAGEVAGA